MKKLSFFILLLSFSSLVKGQNAFLYSSSTEKHQLVNGTNISIIPPASFQASENFKGFQNSEDPNSMIMIIEIPGPFSKVSEGFNAEMLKERGMRLNTKQEVKLSGFKGYLIDLDQEANGLVYAKSILAYGDETFTVLINGVFLKDSMELGIRIKESVLSTVVNSSLKADPRGALNYILDEAVGELKLVGVMGNSMIFNRDLKTPTESEDRAGLISDMSFAKVSIENKKLFCLSRIKKYPGDYSVILDKGVNEIEIDGLNGYELFAKNNEDKTEEMYQVILFGEDGGYYILNGMYLKGSEAALEDIKAIIKTFKRR